MRVSVRNIKGMVLRLENINFKLKTMAYPKFVIKKSSNDKYYFNLHAANAQVIATSEMYESKDGCKNGIQSVKNNAASAEVDDQS